jgi:hypothetical protein
MRKRSILVTTLLVPGALLELPMRRAVADLRPVAGAD